MAAILASIRHNLARVADFSGRESRGAFWPYAIFLFLLSAAVGAMVAVWIMVAIFVRIQQYMIAHPEGLPIPSTPDAYPLPPELMPDVSGIWRLTAVVNFLFALLLAAAVVRRLHDRDKSGWWATLPVPFMVYGQLQGSQAAIMMTGSGAADPATMLPVALNSLFYWVAVIFLIVVLAQEGSNGPNRFGPEPGELT